MHTFVLSAVLSVWIFNDLFVEGALTISESGGKSEGSTTYRLKCEIPTFSGTAAWSRDGVPMSTCFNTGCLTTSIPPYTFQHATDAIFVSFSTLALSEDNIQWTCEHAGDTAVKFNVTIDSSAVTTEGSTEGNNPCVGFDYAVATLCTSFGGPETVRVIICIIMFCWCTQKITITVTADKNKNKILKMTKHKINMVKQQPHSIHQNMEIHIVAQGGELHECVFETDTDVLELTFKITDDLLNVIPGQRITLPTVLEINPRYSTLTWYHNEGNLQNDGHYFTTSVTQSTYGVYDINMTFEHLELTILIEKMRVKGRYWILIVISVPINVLCGVIGTIITEYNRSTDGFCISAIPIIILAVLCVIVNGFLVGFLVYNLIKRRTGNEQNSRPKLASDVTTPPTPSTTSTVTPTIVTSASVTSGTSPSAVITTYSTDQNRRNQKPSKLPDGYDPKITLQNISGNDQILKQNAEQINLLDRKS